MGMEAGHPRGPVSQPAMKKKREKSSSRRPSSEEEEESGDRRQQVFARQDDDETVLAQRASVRGLPAMLSSTSANACKTFVNRDLNGASHFRRYAVLNSRPEELRLSNFVGKPLRLEACQEELKPITSGRSKKRPRGAIDCVFEYALEPTPSVVPRRRSVVVQRSHQCYRRYCGRSGQAFGARQNLRIGKYIRAQVRFMKLGRASKEGRADTKRRLAKPRSQCPRLSRKKSAGGPARTQLGAGRNGAAGRHGSGALFSCIAWCNCCWCCCPVRKERVAAFTVDRLRPFIVFDSGSVFIWGFTCCRRATAVGKRQLSLLCCLPAGRDRAGLGRWRRRWRRRRRLWW